MGCNSSSQLYNQKMLVLSCQSRDWTRAKTIAQKLRKEEGSTLKLEEACREVVIQDGPPELIELIVQNCGGGAALLEGRNERGKTCLHLCFTEGNLNNHRNVMASTLLRIGANPNAQDNSLSTPLLDAMYANCDIGGLGILVNGGADPSLESKLGMSPEKCALARHDAAAKQLFRQAKTQPKVSSPINIIIHNATVDLPPGVSIVEAIPVVIAQEQQQQFQYDIFMSHSWGTDQRDHARAIRLSEILTTRFGISVWIDKGQVRNDILGEISAGLDNSRFFCACITQEYVAKVNSPADNHIEFCNVEFTRAVQTRGRQNIIPIVMESTMKDSSKWAGTLGTVLGTLLFVDYAEPQHLESAAAAIAERVRGGAEWTPPAW